MPSTPISSAASAAAMPAHRGACAPGLGARPLGAGAARRSISGRSPTSISAGPSPSAGRSLDVILERLPNTLLLMGSATALVLQPRLAPRHRRRQPPRQAARPRCCRSGSLALYAVPGFWLGLVLIVIFAVELRWLPLGGIETIASGKTGLGAGSRHRPAPGAAGRRARRHLHGALSADDARRHGRGLAAGLRPRRPRPRHSAPAHRAAPRRPQRAAAAGHHARPAMRRRCLAAAWSSRACSPSGLRPAGRRGGGQARHAALARRDPGQRGAW